MARLSITEAWNETAEFAKRDFGALFAIALALIAFPNFALQALVGAAVIPAGPGPLLLLLVVLFLTIVGTLAITALVLGRENVVGRAIGHGFRRSGPLLAASLIIGLVAMVVLTLLVAAMHIDVEALRSGSVPAFRRFLRAIGLFVLLFLPFWARLLMMSPVAAAERGGPIAIIRRSWTLTRGHFWKLLGLTILLLLVALVVSMAASSVFGLLITLAAGRPEPGNLPALLVLLVNGVVNAVLTVLFTGLVARIYVQLSGGGDGAAGRVAVQGPGEGISGS